MIIHPICYEGAKYINDDWPSAVHPKLICITDEDKNQRAKAILELLIDEPLEECNFFDHNNICQGIEKNYGAKSLGPPYDIVLLFDVIDHVKNPVEVVKKTKELLKSNGKLFVRCHPWLSYNATHDYRTNKAYSHLFLWERPYFHNKQNDYDILFDQFDVHFRREVRRPLDQFFLEGIGNKLLLERIGILPDTLQYIDFKLERK